MNDRGHPRADLSEKASLPQDADGMGIGGITVTRIYMGQQMGLDGEEYELSYEQFPYSSLIKTCNVNQQVPDSAGTSTAFHSGVKTDVGVLGVDADIVRGDYSTQAGNEVMSILEVVEIIGMSTGVISTARITHATPAAAYAHALDRNWEDDKDICQDQLALGTRGIGFQLIDFPYGDGLEVAMGGGRRSFLPTTTNDPEDIGRAGERQVGRDLITERLGQYHNSAFAWNLDQFNAIDPDTTDHFLGLFNRSHMEYELDRPYDTGGEPSFAPRTLTDVDILDGD